MGLKDQAAMCGVIRTHLQNLQQSIDKAVDMGVKVDVEVCNNIRYIPNLHATPLVEIKTYIELTDEVENG